jgi:hypothetical protein
MASANVYLQAASSKPRATTRSTLQAAAASCQRKLQAPRCKLQARTLKAASSKRARCKLRAVGCRGVYYSAADKVANVRLVGGNWQRWSINM